MDDESPHFSEKIFRRNDTLGKTKFRGERNVDKLNMYIAERFSAVLEREPDGILSESLRFQVLEPQNIHVSCYEHDDARLQYPVEGFRNFEAAEAGMLQSVDIVSNIPPQLSFRTIGEKVEDAIIGLPQNGLAFMERYLQMPLPKDLRVMPTTRRFQDNGLHQETRYSDSRLTYEIPDFRYVPLDLCIERAENALRNIHNAVNDTRYELFLADVSRENPWRIRIHRMRLDLVKRFKRLLRAEGLPRGTRIIGEDDVIPDSYVSDEPGDELEMDFSFEQFNRDFSRAAVRMCVAKIEQLLEECQKLLIEVHILRPAYDDEYEPGERPSEDGVSVTFYKSKHKRRNIRNRKTED